MAQKTVAKAAGTAAPEAEYSAKELISVACSKFGVSPDIMAAALKTAGLTRASKSQAKKLAEDFAKKEVK